MADNTQCEVVKAKRVGRSIFVYNDKGIRAFIPLEKICEAAKRFGLCIDSDEIKCE